MAHILVYYPTRRKCRVKFSRWRSV